MELVYSCYRTSLSFISYYLLIYETIPRYFPYFYKCIYIYYIVFLYYSMAIWVFYSPHPHIHFRHYNIFTSKWHRKTKAEFVCQFLFLYTLSILQHFTVLHNCDILSLVFTTYLYHDTSAHNRTYFQNSLYKIYWSTYTWDISW